MLRVSIHWNGFDSNTPRYSSMLNQTIKSEYEPVCILARLERDINMKCVIDTFWGGIYICFVASRFEGHRYILTHIYIYIYRIYRLSLRIGIKHRCVSGSLFSITWRRWFRAINWVTGEAFPKRRDRSSRQARNFSFGENYGLEIRFSHREIDLSRGKL